jgi:transposase
VVHHSVELARVHADHVRIRQVAFDETASRRGHNDVPLYVDLDRTQVLFVADGTDAAKVGAFAADL